MPKKQTFSWKDKVCNSLQLGGIETSVIDNGPGCGTRIAWFNTGSGFRFKVVIDRGLDIVDAFYNSHSLVWISHGGVTARRPDVSQGLEWLYTFPGGLITTCGLDHVGGPEEDGYSSRGLHGRYSNLAARIESIVQPDIHGGKPEMSITGIVKQSRVFGPNLEMRRTIKCTLGQPEITVSDKVTNVGSTEVPHMLLYHCNFGYPLVDKGTDILFKGKCQSRGMDMDNAIFNDRRNYRKCCGPLESHRGGGEACGFIKPQADRSGYVETGLANNKLNLAVKIRYKKSQLPCLANWQHWGIGDYVTGLEPGTNFPIGQSAASKKRSLISLKPGQSRSYQMTISVIEGRTEISRFKKGFIR